MVVTYTKLYQKDEKRRLDTAKDELESMNYHPVREYNPVCGGEKEHNIKRKKLKRCDSCETLTLLPPIFVGIVKIIADLRMTLFVFLFVRFYLLTHIFYFSFVDNIYISFISLIIVTAIIFSIGIACPFGCLSYC